MRGGDAMNTEKMLHIISAVQRTVSSANHHLLERSGGVRYLYGEIAAIDEDDLRESSSDIMEKLSGIAGLLDAVAGALDALAQDMEFCENELIEILDMKDKAA